VERRAGVVRWERERGWLGIGGVPLVMLLVLLFNGRMTALGPLPH
jgi:hypothetical protein